MKLNSHPPCALAVITEKIQVTHQVLNPDIDTDNAGAADTLDLVVRNGP